MSYAEFETSTQSGAPVEFYQFTRASETYRYTSADRDLSHAGQTWASYRISRSAIEATQEQARLALDLEVDPDLPVLDLFRVAPPDDVVLLTVWRLHLGDGDPAVIWMGRVLSVSLGMQASIHCESVHTSIKRPGLRRMYQKQCPHVLYGAACGLDRDDWRQVCSVTSLSGTSLAVTGLTGFADQYFAGGYVEWVDSNGLYERRAIRAQVGGSLTVTFPMPALAAEAYGWGKNWGRYYGGVAMSVFTGCDHVLATCDSKFSNSANYGGMPHIPSKNPFDGTPVY